MSHLDQDLKRADLDADAQEVLQRISSQVGQNDNNLNNNLSNNNNKISLFDVTASISCIQVSVLLHSSERVSSSAEVYGSVQQEARVARAVEVVLAHVDALRRVHERESAELEEAKRQEESVEGKREG